MTTTPEELVQGGAEAPIETIEDEKRASKVLYRVRKLHEEAAQIVERAQDDLDRITAWREDELGKINREIDYLEAQLTSFHRAVLAEDERRKTITFPWGRLKARKGPDGIEVEDPDAFLAWARETRPEFVTEKHTYSIAKAPLKDAVLKDGEVLPGVEPVLGETKFSIEVTS